MPPYHWTKLLHIVGIGLSYSPFRVGRTLVLSSQVPRNAGLPIIRS